MLVAALVLGSVSFGGVLAMLVIIFAERAGRRARWRSQPAVKGVRNEWHAFKHVSEGEDWK